MNMRQVGSANIGFYGTWGTNEGDGPIVVGGSFGAVPQIDRRAVAGEAVEALVVGVVRVEQVAGSGLVHTLLGKAVGAAIEGESVAGAALRRLAVAQVVDTQAVRQAFDLQGGGVVGEPQSGVGGRGGDLLQRIGADRAEVVTRVVVLEDEGVAVADVICRLAGRGPHHKVLA